jgi:polysaccharide export outer membrane protein
MKTTIAKGELVRWSALGLSLFVSCALLAQIGGAVDKSDHQKALAKVSPKAGLSEVQSAAPEKGGKGHDDSYKIGADDLLSISVWKEPEVSRTIAVRSDGRISLPLIGEIEASGQTPKQLETTISQKLQSYISEPDVTVMVQENRSQKFNILGQVAHPGSFPLTHTVTVLDAIAMAGGFRDFAKTKAMYVLRKQTDGTQGRIPFNYKSVIKGATPEQNITLQAGDTLVVP